MLSSYVAIRFKLLSIVPTKHTRFQYLQAYFKVTNSSKLISKISVLKILQNKFISIFEMYHILLMMFFT